MVLAYFIQRMGNIGLSDVLSQNQLRVSTEFQFLILWVYFLDATVHSSIGTEDKYT